MDTTKSLFDELDGPAEGAPSLPRDPAEGPGPPAPFRSADEVLHTSRLMFIARQRGAEAESVRPQKDEHKEAIKLAAAWTEYWHRSWELTGDSLPLCAKCRAAQLAPLEREIIAALLLAKFAMTNGPFNTCGAAMNALVLPSNRSIEALRAFSEQGRLLRSGLVLCDDCDEELADRPISISPALVELVLDGKEQKKEGWPVKTDTELYERMHALTRTFGQLAEPQYEDSFFNPPGSTAKLARKLKRLAKELDQTLDAHPDFKLNALLKAMPGLTWDTCSVLLILIGRELGHLPADHTVFTGIGITRAISAGEYQPNLRGRLRDLLGPESRLIQKEFVRPCGGDGVLVTGKPDQLAELEFELGDASLKLLQLERQLAQTRSSDVCVRPALTTMERLVLSARVQEALRMALAQARHAEVLLKDWGMGDVVPYGRSVVLLFSGPPGTGKTACAEALAHELGRPILAADYSRVQNCFVGNTEKNIVRVFSQARCHGAVLFWDEADAMFYDRDNAFAPWEVRDVNVLLQELEKFEGVCILATNRKITLDAALERRISVKVEFDRPDREMRRQIWTRMLPPKLPLAEDVCADDLAAAELSGGEIKNVVLNAARLALARGKEGPVMKADFEQAVRMELDGQWNGQSKGRAGFMHGK